MKLLKTFAVLGLSSLMAVSTAQAVEKAQNAPKQTQKKDVALERFNQNVGIRLTSRGLQAGQNNQPVVTLTYTIQNKGKNKIKSLSWISAFQVNNQVFYVRELPLNFEPS